MHLTESCGEIFQDRKRIEQHFVVNMQHGQLAKWLG